MGVRRRHREEPVDDDGGVARGAERGRGAGPGLLDAQGAHAVALLRAAAAAVNAVVGAAGRGAALRSHRGHGRRLLAARLALVGDRRPARVELGPARGVGLRARLAAAALVRPAAALVLQPVPLIDVKHSERYGL